MMPVDSTLLPLHFGLLYLVIHSATAQSLRSTRLSARDMLMINLHLPELLVKFFCYYLYCVQNWRVLELEDTVRMKFILIILSHK